MADGFALHATDLVARRDEGIYQESDPYFLDIVIYEETRPSVQNTIIF